MTTPTPAPALSDDLAALRKQYEDARDTYAVTKAYADWTIACEAHSRWLDARSKAAS